MSPAGENKKIILYISGGAMLGVFGAGVVTFLQEKCPYSRVEAVYGTSAGALTGAYFLSRQASFGSSIFYDDLTHKFISKRDFIIGVCQRVWRYLRHNKSLNGLRDAFDVDYLFDVVSNRKRLDLDALHGQKTPLYIKVFNMNDKKIEYLDAHKEDTIALLRASAQLLPYTHTPEQINGRDYIDAGNIETIGYEALRKRHPKGKIIVILNSDKERRLIQHKLKKYIEGLVMSYMCGKEMFGFYKFSERHLEMDIALIKKDGNALLIYPPVENRTFSSTTTRVKLLETYNLGISAGQKILSFINN